MEGDFMPIFRLRYVIEFKAPVVADTEEKAKQKFAIQIENTFHKIYADSIAKEIGVR